MPLSINVGLSRKASRDYQSAGVSINVTAELDQSFLAKPAELQAQVANLYAQADAALERQATCMGSPEPSHRRTDNDDGHAVRGNGNGNGRTNGNGDRGYGNGRRSNGNGSTATDSQRRAIAAIARRMNVDPAIEAREVLGAELDGLSLRQASELIDHLKSLQPTNGRNGR